MVNKELIITLILDCYFFASIYRRDKPNVRFLSYDAETDSAYLLGYKKFLENKSLAYRNISMLPN
jgi:hypothetical protein